MNRIQVYPGAIPLETDLLNTNRNVLIALGKLAGAVFGTGNYINGLSVGANSPAALNVVVQPGELYSLQNIDGTAYSSLAADTAHQIVKQGILLDAVTLSTPAPGTAGQSINYLIQAAFSEVDDTPVVLPYYNASNPTQAYSGPNNSGATNNTRRADTILLNAKAGTAAATGSQTTPAPDAGYIGLFAVTVANGQTTVTASNIAQLATAPILPAGVVAAIQQNAYAYALDSGSANVYQASFYPAVTTIVDGMVLHFRAKTANTGASTFAPNGLTAQPIWGADHAALAGGEIVANGDVWVQWNGALNGGTGAWVLVDSTGGFIKSPTASQFDASAKVATSSFVQAALGSMSNGSSLTNGALALTNAYIGQFVSMTAAATQTFSLPLLSGVPLGASIILHNPTTYTKTVTVQGSDTISPEGNNYTSITLLQGDTVVCTKEANVWRAYGTGAMKYSAQFGASLTGNGYQKLPGGLILQWGTATLANATLTNITLPIAFSSGAFVALATESNGTTNAFPVQANPYSATQITGYQNSGGSMTIAYVVIGK